MTEYTYKLEGNDNLVFEVTVKAFNLAMADEYMNNIQEGNIYKYDIKE